MISHRKKILITIDDSGHGLHSLGYISRLLNPDDMDLVLFSVLTTMPERFWDMEENPSADYEAVAAKQWKAHKAKNMDKFMAEAVNFLVERGVPAGSISVKIQERSVGIARDILQEARFGYDAVIAARQGMNPITRLVIGSVAGKLLQNLTETPLWLVGGGVKNKRLLLAMDASEGAMRAVSHAGAMMGGTDAEITLFYVIRSVYPKHTGTVEQDTGAYESEVSAIESREQTAIKEAFGKASNVLQQAGVAPDQITTKVVSGVATRSGAIATQAMMGGYGTIVMGRRGHSRVGEFYMGGVTNKVIQLASEAAVWVVS
jgi:nucleotide-binding universal stress UspA family protein